MGNLEWPREVTQPPSLSAPLVDASEADYQLNVIREIQPHGILLALDAANFSIVQASANTAQYLGIPPKKLLGTPLSALCNTKPLRSLLAQRALEQPSPEPRAVQRQGIPIRLRIKKKATPKSFDGIVHLNTRPPSSGELTDEPLPSETIILELEPVRDLKQIKVRSLYGRVKVAIERMQLATTQQALLTILVDEVQQLTGYARVLVYKFDAEGAGEVIAEARQEGMTAFKGLHFPARDIPAVCRTLYTRGKLRGIPNIQAKGVPLVPPLLPEPLQSPDLSQSVLRSPNQCFVEYYSNMGVSAALIASLLKEQQLWGLISCHHTEPKKLSFEVQAACELLAQMASSELVNKVRQEELAQRVRFNSLNAEIIASMAQSDNFIEALIQPKERLLTLANATGAAIFLNEQLTLVGATPSRKQVKALADWVTETCSEDLFHTSCLSQVYPDAAQFKDIGSGLLLLQISRVQGYRILWFRSEVIQTVNWGGAPEDGLEIDETGQLKMGPRRSFDLWQETVKAKALPWQPYEIEGVFALRNAIVGIVLQKADDLATLNRELDTSNRDLASFAYAAAHDLKEPLRGIYNYASILQEDYSKDLDQEGLAYLTEIQVFSQRMEQLISALLRLASLRQATLNLQEVDLNDLLEHAVTTLRASRPEIEFDLRIPQPLPQVHCDPVLVPEVFRNLLSNALKYNDQSDKWVEVGYQAQASTSAGYSTALVLYVRDNGIGIRSEHLSKVFQLFRRLHPQEHYGGGVGVGLAIVSQIIERHGGRIWVESEPGEGSTFYFTLSDVSATEA